MCVEGVGEGGGGGGGRGLRGFILKSDWRNLYDFLYVYKWPGILKSLPDK